MNSQIIQLLVLAAIAVFLILRLRGILGTRDGFEPPPEQQEQVQRRFEVIENDKAPAEPEYDDIADHADPQSPAYAALAEMKSREPSFDIGDFLGGAKMAYEMILMAFEKGDLSEVRDFLAPEVAEAFDNVIEQRQQAGHTVEARYLGTHETGLAGASFDPETAEGEVSVRFVGELIAATRDADGKVIDGDLKSARKQRDTWTFARVMGSNDPNWRLVATGV
ncbi:MAG: Tim44/TimA family putative adaptor protein [Paracoccus sp. (in: a-proteobacteria)]|nr:Tim44/TimA family putative adaptor protein [Paracoccus sp. (in: a-proteobacteria)]